MSEIAVYMAGKVGYDCWRKEFNIVNGPTVAQEGWKNWPRIDNAVFEEHRYTGPYYSPGWDFDQIAQECKDAIDAANVVFSWIHKPTAFGSLVEIGWAAALNKYVVFAHPPGFEEAPDMWLAQKFSNEVIVCEDPKEALHSVIGGLKDRWKEKK